MTATGTATGTATPREHSEEAQALERAALDRCMHCRQEIAGRLTALATGLAAAKAIARATGDDGPLEHLAELARDGNWAQANRVNSETTSRLIHQAEQQLLHERSPEGWQRLEGLISRGRGNGITITDDAHWAVFNMNMAKDCLDPDYGPGEDGYRARPEATAEAERVIAAQCHHAAAHQWARDESHRIREKAQGTAGLFTPR